MRDHGADCRCCGAELDPEEFDIRSLRPDVLVGIPEEQLWGGDEMLRHNGQGWLRCLMPVRLTGGTTVTYSVWLHVEIGELKRAYDVWQAPAYADLTLTGTIANSIKPWAAMLGETARAEVRDPDQLPYLVGLDGGLLQRVLTEEWDRDDVLARLPYGLPTTVQQPISDGWTIERGPGLAIDTAADHLLFAGAGRTVHCEAYAPPPSVAPEESIRETMNHPADLTERDGDLLRSAHWTDTELHGYVAVPGGLVCLTCVWPEGADDLEWARHVWRSVRRTLRTPAAPAAP